jgi:glycosyltransferase 2 family protein
LIKVFDKIKDKKYWKILKILGYSSTIISIIYLVLVGHKHWDNLLGIFTISDKWASILISSFLYAISIGLVYSEVWRKLVLGLGGKITFKSSYVLLGHSQIAKYIPGNVFQYVGRHILGKNLGLSNGVIINGIFIETLLNATVAGLIFLVSSLFLGWSKLVLPGVNKLLIIGVAAIIIIIFLVIARFTPKIKSWLIKSNIIIDIKTIKKRYFIYSIIIVILLYALFFTFIGLNLWFLSKYFWSISDVPILFFISAYAIAWVIGFATPGAPGGIGIREVILIAILNNHMNQPKALMLALIFRLVTILGDFLFFSFSYFLKIFSKRILSKSASNNT